LAAVAQVDSFTIGSVVVGNQYGFTIGSTLISYTAQAGDTQSVVLNALLTQVTASLLATGSITGTVLTLTAVQAGQGVSYTLIENLTHAVVTANHGIVDDLLAIQAANDDWYGVALCSNTDADLEQLSAQIESMKKIFIGVTKDAAVATSATTDIASVLKGKSLARTALIYTQQTSEDLDAAWMGGQLPAVPGSNIWAYKNLVGQSPDVLTSGQRTILVGTPVAQLAGKNVNIYSTVGGVDITQMGTMIGGQFIDITIGLDWLESTLQTNVFTALVQSAKIPYTDKGTGILISAVQAAFDQGVVNGLIADGSIVISAPAVLSVPSSQRANRVAPTITASARLAGAYQAVIVNVNISV
jgi:hypothetical protein